MSITAKRELPDDFLSKVYKLEECWIWTGERFGRYGVFVTEGVRIKAHRFAWQTANQQAIPPGLCVCHSCDVPLCVNPRHLWLGSHADNMRDAYSKGRISKPDPSTHWNANKSACHRGHYLSRMPNGQRQCKVCRANRQRARRRGVTLEQITGFRD